MIKSVIWDWNGTLLNDVEASLQAVNSVFSSQNLPSLSLACYRQNIKIPVREFYQEMGLKIENEQKFSEINEIWLKSYLSHFDEIKLSPHAEEVLNFFQQRGLLQYLVSSTAEAELKDQVTRQGIRKYFKEVLGNTVNNGESKQERIQNLIIEDRLNPQETLLVGDMATDYEIARQVGAKYIMFTKGLQQVDNFVNQLSASINDLVEILEYF